MALVSSYTLLGLNIVQQMLTVPLALSYLQQAEFGLWALVLQMVNYIALIDLGMSTATVRTLIDYKDNRDSGEYGTVLLTGGVVSLVQGLIIIAIGVAGSFYAGDWLNVDAHLKDDFVILALGQSIITGLRFAFRPLNLVLYANQRHDLVNWIEGVGVIVATVGLWLGLKCGSGIFSSLWSNGASTVTVILIYLVACAKTRVLPRRGQWGRFCMKQFRGLFSYGKDIFLFIVGYQVITASQVILVTRVLGLDAAGIWVIGIRTYNLIIQLLSRIIDSSTPGLSEMWVRNERDRFFRRYRDVVTASASCAVCAGVMLAACNWSFVELWTSGRVSWPQQNDLLLGLLVFVQVLTRNYTSVAGLLKDFSVLTYIYFIEGFVFVAAGLQALRLWGTGGLIGASILCTCLFSLPASLAKVRRCFDLSAAEILGRWNGPALKVAAALSPVAVLNAWLFHGMPPWKQFFANGICTGVPAAAFCVLFGFSREIRGEILSRLPKRFRRA